MAAYKSRAFAFYVRIVTDVHGQDERTIGCEAAEPEANSRYDFFRQNHRRRSGGAGVVPQWDRGRYFPSLMDEWSGGKGELV